MFSKKFLSDLVIKLSILFVITKILWLSSANWCFQKKYFFWTPYLTKFSECDVKCLKNLNTCHCLCENRELSESTSILTYVKLPSRNIFFFVKSCHHEPIDLWKDIHFSKFRSRKWEYLLFCCVFALKTLSLPRKIMEQCSLCPVISWSNTDFAPRNHGPFCSLRRKITETLFFAPQNYGAMQTLPRKIMET